MKPRTLLWLALVTLALGASLAGVGSAAIFTKQTQNTGNTFTTAASFPIALVQKNYGAAYLTTSVSATFDATPVGDHLLVAILGASTTSTINEPTGWSTAINQTGSPGQAIFYKIAGSGESETVTVTMSDSNSVLGLQIYEYSGIATTSPLDQTNSSTGTSTSPSSGSVTTTQPNELLLVGMVIRAATSYSGWTDSFNEQFDFQFEVGQTYVRTYAGADRVVTATGTYSTTATTAASGAWRGQIATFKNSGGYGGAYRAAYGAAPATSTPTPSTTPTPTPTGTPSPIATPTFTVIPSPTATPTPTPAAMLSPTATRTPTPAAMPSPTATPTLTLAVTPSLAATPTSTPAVMPSPTATPRSAVTPSSKATLTATPTVTPSPTATSTPSCAAGDTGFLNPSDQAADGGGNGFEVNPTDAFADDTSYAVNVDGAGDRHRYYNYSISTPSGCSIKGIEVRLDWWLGSTEGSSSMSVELSWDGGISWTAAKADSTQTASEHTATLGGSTDTWDRTWTPTELSDASFRVRLTSNSSDSLRDFYLDWAPVKVYYGP